MPVRAQVFVASSPNPEFRIGPLFVSATVTERSVTRDPGPVTVTVSWNIVPRPGRSAENVAQDLYLLWPGEVAGSPAASGADPALVHQVEALGFKVKQAGGLRLSARARAEMGTTAPIRALGEVPFVTFARDEGAGGAMRGATYIRIPWMSEFASLEWLVRLELSLKDVIVRRPVPWLEELFWGRRYLIMLGFGDVGYVSLYPLYFGARDRVIPLARDFSMVLINFAEADHLKIDELAPPSATRRMSEVRANTEAVSLPLNPSEGLTPQLLKVRFTYFRGRLPWRPILISGLFLALGNMTGPLVLALARRVARTLRTRIHVGRGEGPGQQSGTVPSRDTLEKIHPGETSYQEVLRLCGPHAEEREQFPSGETRTLVYRGQRVVPHRQRSFGWFSTVSHWDVEHHEVQIDFERDRVRDIQARVRRSRLAHSPLG